MSTVVSTKPNSQAVLDPLARPSFSDPSLALPGQAVQEDTRTALHGRIAEYIIVAAFTVVLAVYEWLRSWMKLPPQPLPISFLAGGMLVYAGIRIWLISPKLRALNAIREGRMRLQYHLQNLGDRGYYAFDRIIDSYGMMLGTVLVGPTGVFVLEIKSYSKSGSPRERIEQPTRTSLFIGGHPAIGNPLRQGENACRRLLSYLENKGVTGYNPRALLVFPGWRIGRTFTDATVRVINEDMLEDVLQEMPTILEARDVIAICQALDSNHALSPCEQT